jgi:hypothetical protein
MPRTDERFNRRTAFKVAGAGALTVAAAGGGLPAWMRPVIAAAQAPGPGTLPFPNLPEGTPTMP